MGEGLNAAVTLTAESTESAESALIQHTNYWIGRVD